MKNNKIFILLLFYAIVAILTILIFDGTGDSGDSIHHYLFAKYAPQYPSLFFNHWAKPVYVLLFSPFAQFGFNGIKFLNAIIAFVTIFFTYKIIQKLNIENPIIGAIILIFSPLYFVLIFSGLTEYLFAMFVTIGLYALLVNKSIIACLIISFLPFVRSEGLIIIGVFGLYFLFKKEWKLIPLLLFGHLVYSFAGFLVYHDLFWVFNKIPYARLGSTYGSGKLFHFAEQLIYVVGVPIYILFWIGVVRIGWQSIKKQTTIELQVLVFFGFFSFFIAHSLFWYLGIFNSMGLKRVFIGVAPLMSIISLVGFNFITESAFQNKKTLKLVSQSLLTAYILIFPFTPNPAAIDWKRDLTLKLDQKTAHKVADFLAPNRTPNQCFVFAHPYLSEVLHLNHFDKQMRQELDKNFMNQTKTGDIIIWENWFAVVEHGITKEYLDNNPDLINIYNLNEGNTNQEIIYAVYQRR